MLRHGGTGRRATPRTSVALDVSLERKVGRAMTVRTLDVGAGGARVTSDRPLRVDEELRFDVELPESRRHVDGTARVLRQDRHNVYALRFEGVTPDALAELRAFVDATADGSVH